jgi:ferrous iron transport protein A
LCLLKTDVIIQIVDMQDSTDTTLDQLPPRTEAVVCGVEGARSVALRLMEMGLLRGTVVEVTRVAPLGDPVELRLRGYALSIRRAQAAQVRVMPVACLEAAE